MFVSLDTKVEELKNLFELPFIGGILIFLVAITPVPLLFILNGIFEFAPTEIIERTNALITGFWNIILTFYFKTKISILLIPCWILFTIIGILRLFTVLQ